MTTKRKRINRNEPKKEEIKEQPQIEEGAQKNCAITKKNGYQSPVIVFAHGAGAPSSSDWMIRWKDMLAEALNAVEVVAFDYPCKCSKAGGQFFHISWAKPDNFVKLVHGGIYCLYSTNLHPEEKMDSVH